MPAEGPTTAVRSTLAVTRSIVAAAALGELTVGVLAVLFPGPVLRFLLQAPLQGNDLVVARMVGVSITALGYHWWHTRHEPRAFLNRGMAGGFLVYNFGLALVFAAYVQSQDRLLPVPLLVAVTHLVIGAAYVVATARSRTAVQSA